MREGAHGGCLINGMSSYYTFHRCSGSHKARRRVCWATELKGTGILLSVRLVQWKQEGVCTRSPIRASLCFTETSATAEHELGLVVL